MSAQNQAYTDAKAVDTHSCNGVLHRAAGVTLNRSLYETVLREVLLERAEHTVELYEGSGAAWRKVRSVPSSEDTYLRDQFGCNA